MLSANKWYLVALIALQRAVDGQPGNATASEPVLRFQYSGTLCVLLKHGMPFNRQHDHAPAVVVSKPPAGVML
ncbi:hypothetical protein D3C86_1867930 [compost metagenome]